MNERIQYIVKNAKRVKYVMADGREYGVSELEHTHYNNDYKKGAEVRVGQFECNWHSCRGVKKVIAPLYYARENEDRWLSVEYEGKISNIFREDASSAYAAEQAARYCEVSDEQVRLNKDGLADLSNWYVILLSYQASSVWRRCGRRSYLNLMNAEELSKEVLAGTGRRINQNIRVFGSRKNALNFMYKEW